MHRILTSLALFACVAGSSTAALAQPAAPELSLTRLDCGTSAPAADVGRFSDIFSHNGLVLQLVFSCYLIKHGDDYLLWDTGHSMSAGAVAPKVSIVDQLAQLAGQAGAGQVRRHQPLPPRPHRPGRPRSRRRRC